MIARVADRLVSEAQAVAGAPAALYVADLDGRSLRRVAGDASLPDTLETVQLVGPRSQRAGRRAGACDPRGPRSCP